MPIYGTPATAGAGPNDLTTLENVKGYLGLTDSVEARDDLLQRIITAASALIESILGRTIANDEYTETRNGNGTATMVAKYYPVTAVSSLTVDGTEIHVAVSQTDSGYLYDEDGFYLRGYLFSKGVKNVSISYTAGYSETPADIEDMCIELVAKKYKYREHIGQASKILAGETVTYERYDLTKDMKSILRNYQNVVPL